MPLLPLIGIVVLAWAYCTRIAYRWDRWLGDDTPIGWVIGLAPLGILCMYKNCKPISNRWSLFPRPTREERIAAAEARSLELEQECGLDFDEVFMLPGYRGDEQRAAYDFSQLIIPQIKEGVLRKIDLLGVDGCSVTTGRFHCRTIYRQRMVDIIRETATKHNVEIRVEREWTEAVGTVIDVKFMNHLPMVKEKPFTQAELDEISYHYNDRLAAMTAKADWHASRVQKILDRHSYGC